MNSSQVRNKIHEHYQQPSEFHYSLLEAYHILMAIPLFIRARQGRRRPARCWCVKLWIERRLLFGQYHIRFQELERESEGDCIGYIRISRDMFAELLLRVTPLTSKSNRQVYIAFNCHFELQLSFAIYSATLRIILNSNVHCMVYVCRGGGFIGPG